MVDKYSPNIQTDFTGNVPRVFILVLNWNSPQDTVECVESLLSITYPVYDILIIDNGSTDDSDFLLRTKYPKVRFIQTGSNLGYAGGNNVGIKYALDEGAEYIWILNNDTIVQQDALSQMIKTTMSDDAIGMVGSKIFYYSDPNLIWCVGGGNFDLEHGGITSLVGCMQKDSGQFKHLKDIDYVAGTSLLCSKKLIEKIGMIPEEYFLYFEETAWNIAARKAGLRTVVAEQSVVWHKVKTGEERLNVNFVYYMTRNRFLLMRKVNPEALIVCMQYQYTEGKNLLLRLLNKKRYGEFSKYLKTILLAWWHGLVANKTGKIALAK